MNFIPSYKRTLLNLDVMILPPQGIPMIFLQCDRDHQTKQNVKIQLLFATKDYLFALWIQNSPWLASILKTTLSYNMLLLYAVIKYWFCFRLHSFECYNHSQNKQCTLLVFTLEFARWNITWPLARNSYARIKFSRESKTYILIGKF